MRLLLYFFLFKGKKNYQTYSFKCIDKDGFIDKPCILLFCFAWQHRSFSFIFPLFSLFITQTFLYWQSPSSIRKCDCQLSYFGISCMKFQYSNKYSVQFDVKFSMLARNVIVLLVNLGFLTCFNSSVKFPPFFSRQNENIERLRKLDWRALSAR